MQSIPRPPLHNVDLAQEDRSGKCVAAQFKGRLDIRVCSSEVTLEIPDLSKPSRPNQADLTRRLDLSVQYVLENSLR